MLSTDALERTLVALMLNGRMLNDENWVMMAAGATAIIEVALSESHADYVRNEFKASVQAKVWRGGTA